MTVFWAMLVDAYRELSSKFLFWIVLGMSGLVILFYASMGFNEEGMFLFFGLKQFDSQFLNSESPLSSLLYRGIFSSFIVSLWLAWIATILALVSTSSIFPDFIASGAVDIVLAKPISRTRLFLMKYIVSLLFVVLQVTVFCIGVFICMGWRIGEWEPKIFLAIPIVTVFFSYLFSFNVLIGVRTRSAMAALLFTGCLWLSIFAVNMAEGILVQVISRAEAQIDIAQEAIDAQRVRIENIPDIESTTEMREDLFATLAERQEQVETQRELQAKIDPWFTTLKVVKTVMPKTQETIGLLERELLREGEVGLMDIVNNNIKQTDDGRFVVADYDEDHATMVKSQEYYLTQSLWYILGTSLAFEAVVLSLACFFFVRRDF